jgi:formylglycine-generating enzyme required for sulfatase activity
VLVVQDWMILLRRLTGLPLLLEFAMLELNQPTNLTDAFGPPEFPPIWAGSWGDDDYGLFAVICVGNASQLFRWVPPGSFLMGSPKEERGRFESEGPQHRVTLTDGLWMADTACTQAFWAAVMEVESRSYFKGATLPVESVDWNESDAFAKRLTAQLKASIYSFPQSLRRCEFAVGLPTEAQWEYACRAKSITAFNVGKTITSEQANFDGNYPYLPGDAKGRFLEKTVPVKTYLPNAWGLFEMHGNVWEWCVDDMRTYQEQDEVDPGLQFLSAVKEDIGNDSKRAIRGGSWGDEARYVRSADRYAGRRIYRYQDLGLRLVLRSSGPTSS